MTYDTSAEHHQVAPESVPPASPYPTPPPNLGYAAQAYPPSPGYAAQPYPAQQYAAPGQQLPVQPYPVQPFPGQSYAAPAYGVPNPQTIFVQAPSRPGRGLSVTALVMGIVAAVLFWVPGLNLVMAVIATVFGAVGLAIAIRRNGPKGMAIAGLVLGVVVLGWSVLMWAVVAAAASGA
jgi:hypothetical protein